jgi:hypothetical protein
MSANGHTPRIYALDRLGTLGPNDNPADVVVVLVDFLRSIGEATVAASAHRALERTESGE